MEKRAAGGGMAVQSGGLNGLSRASGTAPGVERRTVCKTEKGRSVTKRRRISDFVGWTADASAR